MSMISKMIRTLGGRAPGRRAYAPLEVRDLIQKGELVEAALRAQQLHANTPQRELVATCLRAEIAFRQHEDHTAESLYREALKKAPGMAEAHYGLSLVMLARGQAEAAIRHVQFAVNKFNLDPRFNAQLGLCQLELGNYSHAAKSLGRATRLEQRDKSSWNNLGIASRAHGDWEGSRRAFLRALEIDPAFESARNNLTLLEQDRARHVGSSSSGGSALPDILGASPHLAHVRSLADDGKLSEAIDACERLIQAQLDDGSIAIELFRLYRDSGDVATGLDVLAAHLSRRQDDGDVLCEMALALVRERQFKAAKPLLQKALSIRPDDVDLLVGMAETRVEQGRYADAGELMERAFAVDSGIHMKGRLAASHLARCNYRMALELVDQMLAEEPRVSDSVVGIRVEALTHLGRHDEALPILDDFIGRFPNEPERRFPRATIHLLNGRFGVGWDDYAYRNLASVKHLRMVAFPVWNGEPLVGKSVLILAEQGLGDQVMFASCLPDVLALNPRRVVVEVVDRVAPTIARSFPACEVVATKQDSTLTWVKDVGEIDYFIPMGDLPQRFRRDTEAFPQHRGYLSASPTRVEYWRRRLAALSDRPKIGVSWRGGTEQTRSVLRTMSAEQLGGIAKATEADWICLQYGPVEKDLSLAAGSGMPLHYWPEAISDLDEFAALVSALDLVVTVCNTTVHYAGALGRPVWVMAPRVPEWRYGLRFKTLPWYPSSVMYRQTSDGDWDDVLRRVGNDLAVLFDRDSSFRPSRGLSAAGH
jgi:tetratricopeptide (TPR) repeat protein